MPALQKTRVEPATILLKGREIYERVVQREIPAAQRFVWLGTADIKDLHVQAGRRFVPFLAVLNGLLEKGCEIRLIHAKEPGPRFRADFDRYPALLESHRFERALCPRVHFKCVIIDGKSAFISSANLTGAAMGARGTGKRNFEAGLFTHDPTIVAEMMEYFDSVFMGRECRSCRLRRVCPDPIA